MKIELQEPILIEIDGEMSFIIVDTIDLSALQHNQISIFGDYYHYDEFAPVKEGRRMIVKDLNDNVILKVNEDDEIIED